MAGQLAGKVMLVTGGASGIGRATALACAREGARLIIADLQEEGGQHTVHLITEQGGEASFVQTDVTQATAVEALIVKAVERYGRLDCAHNNAGISGRGIAGDHRALTAEYPDDRWHQVIASNLTGVWLCMKYELRQMLTQGGGAIVNTASIGGLVALPGNAAYCRQQARRGGPHAHRGRGVREARYPCQLCVPRVYPHADDGTRDARP